MFKSFLFRSFMPHYTIYFAIVPQKNQCGAGVFLCGVGRWPDAAKNPLNFKGSHLEQETGVEPAFQAWEARVLPMYYSCKISSAGSFPTDIFYYDLAICQVRRPPHQGSQTPHGVYPLAIRSSLEVKVFLRFHGFAPFKLLHPSRWNLPLEIFMT